LLDCRVPPAPSRVRSAGLRPPLTAPLRDAPHPTQPTRFSKEAKLVDHIKWDLAFDGTDTETEFDLSWDLLHISLRPSDHGLTRSP
jgi:hypothetical protein